MDESGRKTAVSGKIILDTQNPKVLSFGPSGLVSSRTPTIDVSYSDEGLAEINVSKTSLTVDGKKVSAMVSTTGLVYTPSEQMEEDKTYAIKVIVYDKAGNKAEKEWQIKINTINSAPVANAGADQKAVVGNRVVLDC